MESIKATAELCYFKYVIFHLNNILGDVNREYISLVLSRTYLNDLTIKKNQNAASPWLGRGT